jgi:hypothetical protein
MASDLLHITDECPTESLAPSARTADAGALLDHRHVRRALSPEAAPPGAYLELEGPAGVLLLPLERDVTHIGRSLSADVRIEYQGVSRRHAIVVRRRDGVRLLDDRSANGTFVNGRRVTAAELSDGDVIALGGVAVRYRERRVVRRAQRAFDGWLSTRMRSQARARRLAAHTS